MAQEIILANKCVVSITSCDAEGTTFSLKISREHV